MIFPLEQLVKFTGEDQNIYEITCAASHRAYQLSKLEDPVIAQNDGKVVSIAAQQLFTQQIKYIREEK
ncbi:MAG: DNA-directed RNA polymerase subunit omega [Spirochaetaceae bacterium]|jgi:DNA-directed RNA polymerase subunit omega|nr:DNA-directed RNA polymerase subunit omega [Spirochaetaceae bacterium]MBR6216069.1 DNA-directed RNA polymerase subunit omega [Spirochaetaceae bacterium]